MGCLRQERLCLGRTRAGVVDKLDLAPAERRMRAQQLIRHSRDLDAVEADADGVLLVTVLDALEIVPADGAAQHGIQILDERPVEVVERDASGGALLEDQTLHLGGHGIRRRVEHRDLGPLAADEETRPAGTVGKVHRLVLVQEDHDGGVVSRQEAGVEQLRGEDVAAADRLQDLVHRGAQGQVFDLDCAEAVALRRAGDVSKPVLENPQLRGGLALRYEVGADAGHALFLVRGVEDT